MKLLIAFVCLAIAVTAQLSCNQNFQASDKPHQMLGFGANWNGQLSPQRNTNPVQTIPSLMYVASLKAPQYTKISVGLQHALVLEANGKVYAAGDGSSAQLGGGITTVNKKVETYSTWEQVLIGKQPERLTDKVIDIAAGWYTSCAIVRYSDTKTTVFCSGKNNRGQLGNSSVKTQISYPIPLEFDETQLAAGEHFVKIAAGADHMVAITSQDNVWAWGAGTEGELGNGANTDSKVPVKMAAVPTRNGRDSVEEIQCGFRFCIALTKDKTNGDGSLYGWGRNDANQLGLGTAESQETVNTPTLIISGGVTSFSVGGAHTLALINGKLHTFGSGTMGQTGHPKTISDAMQEEWTVATPTAIPAFANVNIASFATGMKHSIVHDACNKVYAMGAEALGALGLGTQGSATKEFRRMEPFQITSLIKRNTNVIKVYAGAFNSFIVGELPQ